MNKKLLTKCAALIAAGIMCNSIVVPAMADEVTNNSAPAADTAAAAVPAAPAADTAAAAVPAAPAADTTAAAVPAAPAADTTAAAVPAADAAPAAAADAAANIAYGQEFADMNEQAVEEQSLYTDVATTHWAYDSIKRCAEKAWFSGYPDGTFHPNGNITRGEAMKVFVVFLGITPTQVTESSYEDVSPTSWYAPYIEAGKGLLPTVTNFNGSAPFRPEMPVTREDTMYAIVTALGYASETAMADQSVLNMFSDKDSISEICKPYVTVGVNKKLISGYEDGRIAAQDPLTRAQFAAMLDRASRAGFAAVQPGQFAAAAASGEQQSTDAAAGKGSIRGVVLNALTRQPVEGASVTIDGVTVASDSAGVYKLDNVDEGSHSISAAAEGLEPGLSRVTVEADTVSEAEPMMMAQGTGTATLHGTVYDAANRKPVPEAKLIVSGMGREVVIYSDEKGEYSLQTPVGSYNVITTKTNYIPQTRILVAQNDLDLVQDFTLSKILSSDQARFVLSWDVESVDLDMHLTGPTLDGNDRFHIWFNETDYYDKTGIIKSIVNITDDDKDGYGPETLTIDKKQNGSYIVSVHDYSNKSNVASNALSTSGARVEVYLGGYLIKTYYVPSFKTGNLWTVCEFDGSNIIDINTVTSENESSYKKEEQEGEPTAEAQGTKSDASVIYKFLPDKEY